MNRTQLLVIVGLGLAGGLALLFWPKQSDQQQVHLKIVGRAVEQGKQVVFLRVEGAGSRRIQIAWVARIIGDWRTGCSVETDVTGVLLGTIAGIAHYEPGQWTEGVRNYCPHDCLYLASSGWGPGNP